jgi:hypothetical protein
MPESWRNHADIKNASMRAETQAPASLSTGDRANATSAAMEALIDAKVAACEARTETLFARRDGKLDLIVSELAHIRTDVAGFREEIRGSARATRNNIWAGVGVILSVVGILIALASTTFDLGLKLREIVRDEAQAQPKAVAQAPVAASQVPTAIKPGAPLH